MMMMMIIIIILMIIVTDIYSKTLLAFTTFETNSLYIAQRKFPYISNKQLAAFEPHRVSQALSAAHEIFVTKCFPPQEQSKIYSYLVKLARRCKFSKKYLLCNGVLAQCMGRHLTAHCMGTHLTLVSL
jgi:hypothetical protein